MKAFPDTSLKKQIPSSKTALFYLLFLPLLVGTSNARIGETAKQCDDRYGKPEISGNDRIYNKSKSGIFIGVTIANEKCSKITYIFPKDILLVRNTEKSLHPLVVAKLLRANGEGEKWVKVDFKEYTKAKKYISLDSGKYAYFTEELVTFFNAESAIKDEKIDKGIEFTKGL